MENIIITIIAFFIAMIIIKVLLIKDEMDQIEEKKGAKKITI